MDVPLFALLSPPLLSRPLPWATAHRKRGSLSPPFALLPSRDKQGQEANPHVWCWARPSSSPQAIVSFLAVKIYPPFLSRCAMFPFLRRGGAYVAEILPGTEPWLSEKAELYKIKDGFCKMRLRLGRRNSDLVVSSMRQLDPAQ